MTDFARDLGERTPLDHPTQLVAVKMLRFSEEVAVSRIERVRRFLLLDSAWLNKEIRDS